MANHKSALKRVGITAKKNLDNRMMTSKTKTIVKKFDAAVESGNKDQIDAAFVEAVKAVDVAASKGVIHKNAANRKKAQMAKKVNA